MPLYHTFPSNCLYITVTLHERHDISDHLQKRCLLNSLFRLLTKTTPKLRIAVRINRWPMEIPTKGSVMWKVFPCPNVIMKVFRQAVSQNPLYICNSGRVQTVRHSCAYIIMYVLYRFTEKSMQILLYIWNKTIKQRNYVAYHIC